MRDPNWTKYYQATLTRPLHPMYEELSKHIGDTGRALELGCGVGTGAMWLAKRGFDVHCVDAQKEAIDHLIENAPEFCNITTELSSFEELNLRPDSYDLIVAQFCLFFMEKNRFMEFWPRLQGALSAGGVFMGTFLGKNDTWADEYTSLERAEVDDLLYKLHVEYFEDAERDGETSIGEAKHWHVYHVIARKG